jgi:hypothetical protein
MSQVPTLETATSGKLNILEQIRAAAAKKARENIPDEQKPALLLLENCTSYSPCSRRESKGCSGCGNYHPIPSYMQ